MILYNLLYYFIKNMEAIWRLLEIQYYLVQFINFADMKTEAPKA